MNFISLLQDWANDMAEKGLSHYGQTKPEMLEEMLQKPNPNSFWFIIPLFVILFYVVWKNIREKRYSVVFGGVAFWLWDVFNETWNSMVYALTGQPVWGTTAAGGSAFQILIGYNIEISIMFMFLGMATCYMIETTKGYEGEKFFDGNKNYKEDPNNLYYMVGVKKADLTPEQYKTKKKAIKGRIMTIVLGSISAVIIECILNAFNMLTWEKVWWQWYFPFVLFIIGYVPFFVCAVLIHDAPRKWQLIGLGIELGIVVLLIIIAACLGMLGPQLGGLGHFTMYW